MLQTTPVGLDPEDWAPRKLTFQAARLEQLLYWSGKTHAERLAVCTALTYRMYALRGVDLDESKTDLTPSRVSRRKR